MRCRIWLESRFEDSLSRRVWSATLLQSGLPDKRLKRPTSKLFQDSFLFHHTLSLLLSLFLLFTQPSFGSVLSKILSNWCKNRQVLIAQSTSPPCVLQAFVDIREKPKSRLNLDIVLILSIFVLKIANDNCFPLIVVKSSTSYYYLSHLLVPQQLLSL
jgi:hypothetical protein